MASEEGNNTQRVNLVHRHPGTQHLMQFFSSDHLPPKLSHIAGVLENAAHHMMYDLEDGPELTAGLRKLLEAKDCFVRQRVLDLKAEGTAPPANTPEPELRG